MYPYLWLFWVQLKRRGNKKAAITAAMGWEIIALIIMIALGLLAALLIINKIFLMGGKF